MRTQLNPAILALLLACHFAGRLEAEEFFVSASGNDANSGTREKAFATLERARDAARKLGGRNQINLLAGDYFLPNPFTLDQRDNDLTIAATSDGKATLYGGKPVSGWQRDGDKFWFADLPEVKAGKWDFRVLLVNGRMAEHARLPETGTLFHRGKFEVNWLSSAGGGWARPPTKEEATTLVYNPKDIPSTFEPRNAEVRVYHQWDESLVGVVTNDTARQALILQMTRKPPGAFGISNYVVFNTREGMTHAGQWYLDRPAGRVVYWPLPNEDMAKAKVIAPILERVIAIAGGSNAPVEHITLRGFAVQATTTPLTFAGFAAEYCDGAVSLKNAKHCTIENLEVANTGGSAIKAVGLDECQICGCEIHHTGGTGLWAAGGDVLIASNHVHDIGKVHLSAVGIHADHNLKPEGKGFQLLRNEISEVTYCGIHGLGASNLVEGNLIYRVMLEMHDGGAIYGMMRNSIIRKNFVRDVVKFGQGYDVLGYYLDEGSENCVVEQNVSVGVEVPAHFHIARNIAVRDNVFTTPGEMRLVFIRSLNCSMEGNTLYAGGNISVTPPNAITMWTNNILYQNVAMTQRSVSGCSISGAMPVAPPPKRGGGSPWSVDKAAAPPTIDGKVSVEEWPSAWLDINRDRSGWPGLGARAFASLAYDDRNLYVMGKVILLDISRLQKDNEDFLTIAIGGNAGVLVLRGFANGKFTCAPESGATAATAERLSKDVCYAASAAGQSKGDFKSSWQCEWAIPFTALGIKPEAGKTLPFNLGIHRNEDGVQRYLESPQGELWQLDKATELKFK